MTFLLILLFIAALAVLAPRYGSDSRRLEGGASFPLSADDAWSRRP